MEQAITENKTISGTENPAPASATTKLTALWGLSESALGGVLHAFKIPFRGMVMSSIAIVLISMIAKFSAKRGQIIRSTFAVVLIKAFVSPHTPLTAYFSVFMQGLLGEIFFFTRRFKLLSSLLLGITVSLLNGFQKIIVLTVIYGQNLWKTIDDFYIFINHKWFDIAVSDSMVFSKWLIGGYILIHLAAGVVAGLLAYIIPAKVETAMSNPLIIPPPEKSKPKNLPPKAKRKHWFKPSTIIIIVLSVLVILLSYLYPETDRFDVSGILIMLVRSFLIMALWFYVVAPLVRGYFVKFFNKKRQNSYAGEMNAILQLIPSLRSTIASSWESSKQFSGIKRFSHFIIYSVAILLKEEKE